MAMYITKVWGPASDQWPAVTFSQEGIRNRLRGLWQPGDTMLLVGTQTEPTSLSDRGKVLGYIEFTSVPIATRDIVDPNLIREHGDKWPFALLALRSWTFRDKPPFKEFLPEVNARYPGRVLAIGFGSLTGVEEAKVRSLEVITETFSLRPEAERAAAQTDLLGWLREQRGPAPSTNATYTVERTSQLAKTYLLCWSSRNLMKIGWSIDPVARALHLSEPLVTQLTNEQWVVLQTQSWPDEQHAYLMEQAFLDGLKRNNVITSGEYFFAPVNRKLVEVTLWSDAMISAKRAYRLGAEAPTTLAD